MIAETHNHFADPHRIECTRVVVRNRFNDPIAVILEIDERTYQIYTQDDPDFNLILQRLNIEGAVVVDTLDPQKLPQLPGELWTP